MEGEESLCNAARVPPHTSYLVKEVRRPCAQPPLDVQRAERLRTSQRGEKGTPMQTVHMPIAPPARWSASVRVGAGMAWCVAECT